MAAYWIQQCFGRHLGVPQRGRIVLELLAINKAPLVLRCVWI